jgi:hypothetical protein
VATKAWWASLRRDLTDHLHRTMTVDLLANEDLTLYGRVGETPEAFAQRCRTAAGDRADSEIAALQSKYRRRIADKERQLDTAERRMARHESQRATTVATDVLGGLFGRSSLSASARRAGTAQRRVEASRDRVEDLQAALDDLRIELDEEAAAIRREWEARAAAVGTVQVPLEKADIRVSSLGLVWIPMGT